jgi:hypothetical protein
VDDGESGLAVIPRAGIPQLRCRHAVDELPPEFGSTSTNRWAYNGLLAPMDRSRRPGPSEFVPWDIEVARLNFGANCGPSAFAAATGREVCRIMRYFAHFEQSQCWTNLTHMRRAFEQAGYNTEVSRLEMPVVGVALIQWTGPHEWWRSASSM